MKITTRQIAVTAAMIAIVILLGAPPLRLGYIPFLLGTAITLIHIPVIVGAVLEGPVVGLVIGLLFGLSSLLWAYWAPTGPGDLYFRNPLLSVLPRLFIGPMAYLAYRLVRAPRRWTTFLVLGVILAVAIAGPILGYGTTLLGGNADMQRLVLVSCLVLGLLALAGLALALAAHGELAASGAAAVVGTLTNTALVLTMLGVLSSAGVADPPLPWSLLLAIGLTNGLPEVIAAVVITVAVVAAWKQISGGRKGARILNE